MNRYAIIQHSHVSILFKSIFIIFDVFGLDLESEYDDIVEPNNALPRHVSSAMYFRATSLLHVSATAEHFRFSDV